MGLLLSCLVRCWRFTSGWRIVRWAEKRCQDDAASDRIFWLEIPRSQELYRRSVLLANVWPNKNLGLPRYRTTNLIIKLAHAQRSWNPATFHSCSLEVSQSCNLEVFQFGKLVILEFWNSGSLPLLEPCNLGALRFWNLASL